MTDVQLHVRRCVLHAALELLGLVRRAQVSQKSTRPFPPSQTATWHLDTRCFLSHHYYGTPNATKIGSSAKCTWIVCSHSKDPSEFRSQDHSTPTTSFIHKEPILSPIRYTYSIHVPLLLWPRREMPKETAPLHQRESGQWILLGRQTGKRSPSWFRATTPHNCTWAFLMWHGTNIPILFNPVYLGKGAPGQWPQLPTTNEQNTTY